MAYFTAFRGRILSALATAGVAQACGGVVNQSAADEAVDGGTRAEPEPGCPVMSTLEQRITEVKNTCGGGSCFSSAEETRCYERADLAAKLRPCAAPLLPGACPAVTDLTQEYCSVNTTSAVANGNSCCYQVMRLSCAVPGRPLRVNGSVCLPEVIAGAPLPDAIEPGLDAGARGLLAEIWCEGGRFEYASVAAFARTTMQLLTLGAPVELVTASQKASLDEIEHARLCFALASRFAGRELAPGRLPAEAATGAVSLVELAAETVVGGCVGETVAALMAEAQLDCATDGEVRSALERIAVDEADHAELAWRIVQWAWRVGDAAARTEIASAFEAALTAWNECASSPETSPTEGHGHLSPSRERAIRNRVLSEVVAPCARALMAA